MTPGASERGESPRGSFWLLVSISSAATLVAFIGATVLSAPGGASELPVDVTPALQFTLVLSAVAWVKLSRLRLRPALRMTRPPAWSVLLGVVLAVASTLVGTGMLLIYQRFLPQASRLAPSTYGALARASGGPLAFMAMVGLMPGICEEVFFRGALQSSVLRKLSPRLAIPLIAVLFAVGHRDVYRLPAQFTTGLALGWLAWRAGSIFPAIAMHVTHNLGGGPILSAAYATWQAWLGKPEPGGVGYPIALISVGALVLVAVLALAARILPPPPNPSTYMIAA